MPIVKIAKKERNYLTIAKNCLEETGLSWGAKGLHAYLVGKPENWSVNVKALTKCGKQGRDAIYNYLNELIHFGYIEREETREAGRFKGAVYIVYELPITILTKSGKSGDGLPLSEKPFSDKPVMGRPYPEKPILLNIDNNKQRINEKKKAASVTSQSTSNIAHIHDTMAAAFSSEDRVIGETLTEKQLDVLKTYVITHSQSLCYLQLSHDELLNALEMELLDKTTFKKTCGFQHKFNAIKGEITKQIWQPTVYFTQKQSATQNKVRALQSEIKELQFELNSYETILQNPIYDNQSSMLELSRTKITDGNKQLKQLIEQLTLLKQDPHDQMVASS